MNWAAIDWLETRFNILWDKRGYRLEQYSFEFETDLIRFGVATGKSCGPFISIKEDEANGIYHSEPFTWEEIEAICGRDAEHVAGRTAA